VFNANRGDEITEFLTAKTKRKKYKNNQNILLDHDVCCYPLFWGYLQKKTVKILKPCREIGKSFEQSLQGGKLI